MQQKHFQIEYKIKIFKQKEKYSFSKEKMAKNQERDIERDRKKSKIR